MKKFFKMKSFLSLILVSGFFLFTFTLNAQNIDGVIAGIKSGSSSQISDNSGDNILLTIMEQANTYSKAQAQQILKDFFSKNVVKGFDLKHKGDSPNGRYAIGTLSTSNGNYRVNIFMKNEKGKEIIKELRFQLIE